MGELNNMKFLLATLAVFCFLAYVHADITVVGPANGLCAGVEKAPKSAEDRSRVYLTRCTGDFNKALSGKDAYDKTWGWLSQEILGIALVRGADGEYLTAEKECKTDKMSDCKATDNIRVMKTSDDKTLKKNGFFLSKSEEKSGTGTYAYTSTGAYFGGAPSGPGFYAGTATSLCTKGPIKVKTNNFDIAGTQKSACIAAITGGGTDKAACGTERTFKTGHYKFSLFGHTSDDAALNLNKALTESPKGSKKFDHVGFRQLVKVGGTPDKAKITGGVQLSTGEKVEFTNALIGGKDVKGFQLCVNGQCLEYAFPTKYNSGKIDAAGDAKVDKNAQTSDIKVKVSVPPTAVCKQCAYVDYLLPIGKMTTKDWWFAYDPEVAKATPMATGTTTAAASHTTQLSLVASVVAVMVAVMKF